MFNFAKNFKTNKMKKLILVAATSVALFLSQDISAQAEKGAYVSINAGYGFGAGNNSNEVLGSRWGMFNLTQNTPLTSTSEFANVSLGKGLNFGAAFGYMFNKYVGGELGISYLMGGKSDAKQTFLSGDYINDSVEAKMLQIKPTLVISGGFSKINPYAKFGIVIGVGTSVNIEREERDGTDLYMNKTEFSGTTSIGFQGGAGLLYSLNDKISLFGELNLVNLSYSPEKASFTEYTLNGVNVLPALDVSDKEIRFSDTIVSNAGPSNPTIPTQELKTTFNLGSLGLNFGMRYNF